MSHEAVDRLFSGQGGPGYNPPAAPSELIPHGRDSAGFKKPDLRCAKKITGDDPIGVNIAAYLNGRAEFYRKQAEFARRVSAEDHITRSIN